MYSTCSKKVGECKRESVCETTTTTYGNEAQSETQVVMFEDRPPKLPEEAENIVTNVQPSYSCFQKAEIDPLLHEMVTCFLVCVLSQGCASTISTQTHTRAHSDFKPPIAISNSACLLHIIRHGSSHGLQPEVLQFKSSQKQIISNNIN